MFDNVHQSWDFSTLKDNKQVPLELRNAVSEEWMRFLKERLEQMEQSEVEYHNIQVVGFCWPTQLLEFLSQRKVMAVMGAAKDRRELESVLYFNEKQKTLEKRLKANN